MSYIFNAAVRVLILTVAISSVAFAAPPSATLDVKADTLEIQSNGRQIPVTLKSPRFTIDDATVGGLASTTGITGDVTTGARCELRYAPVSLPDGSKIDVRLFVQWSPKESVLRKWAKYRLVNAKSPALLKEVVLDDLYVRGMKVWTHGGLHGSADGYTVADFPQSHPFFMDGFFTGIEFPISAARLEKDHLILGHKPGLMMQPETWYETRKAVYGVTEKGFERRTFERYINAHRPRPQGFHVNYNSWLTSSMPYTEEEILGLIQTFDEKLYKPYGASFDTFCIDLGWSTRDKVWEIDHKQFPNEFAGIRDAARKSKSSIGLWLSPTNGYSPASFDNEIAAKDGYEMMNLGGLLPCLGAKKYPEQLKNRMVDMAQKYGVKHYKLDFYLSYCPETTHGHQPGDLSNEPIAEGLIAAMTAVRKVQPEVWLEPTCFGFNPSPWWLFYTNSVIGTFGNDFPSGRVPCPVYRESYTTARDYYNLQGAGLLPVPIAAQEVLGLWQQSPEPFMNDGVITVMRGHMFLPMYINPKYMNDSRWTLLAGLINWARKNSGVLQETVALLPASWQDGISIPRFTSDSTMPDEPYGYAHFKGNKGLVALRNPWIMPHTYSVKLDEFIGVPSGASGISAVSIYPEPRVYGKALKYGDTLDVKLAPYETLVLSMAPKQKLSGLPDASSAVLNQISVNNVEESTAKVETTSDGKSAIRLRFNGKVGIASPDSRLLVLLVGVNKSPVAQLSHLNVNGIDVSMEQKLSSPNSDATGQPVEERWTFMSAPLSKGENAISLDLLAGDDTVRASVWVWATKPGSGPQTYPNSLPQPELISLDSKQLIATVEAKKAVSTDADQAIK
ncbi:MAG: alpha-galactosidase [Armatimonadota bacterium]